MSLKEIIHAFCVYSKVKVLMLNGGNECVTCIYLFDLQAKLRVYESRWSQSFSMDTVGSSGVVVCHDKERGRKYMVGLLRFGRGVNSGSFIGPSCQPVVVPFSSHVSFIPHLRFLLCFLSGYQLMRTSSTL